MSNFAFLPEQLSTVRDAAVNAEGHINGDPRSACFQCRFALESIVHWLYRYERRLDKPYDDSLGTLLHEPKFQELMPPQVFQVGWISLRIHLYTYTWWMRKLIHIWTLPVLQALK